MYFGADRRNRTPGLRITNTLLYQLSYTGIGYLYLPEIYNILLTRASEGLLGGYPVDFSQAGDPFNNFQ